jgi:hypothetical protein
MDTWQTKALREDVNGKRKLKAMIGYLLRKVRWSLFLLPGLVLAGKSSKVL